LVVLLIGSDVSAGPITEVVAFGDSLTDTGNVYAITGNTVPASPPYFSGHFSNGPLWVEQLAAGLGVPAPTPSIIGGNNNAFAGAETSLSGVSIQGTPNIGPQVSSYLSSHPALNSGQLIVLWGGANDFLRFPFRPLPDPALPVSNLAAEITMLAQAGGKNFLVPNLPLLGTTPYVQQQLAPFFPGIVDTMNGLTLQFNSLLSTAEDDLEARLGINIIRLDVFNLFQQIPSDPVRFGFTNVTDQAKGGGVGEPGVVVPNPNQYLFWDPVHPTARFHQLLGEQALARVTAELDAQPVPEPSSFVVVLIGTTILLGRRWASARVS
jgi:phospholipase/lecithinase/hemolysin